MRCTGRPISLFPIILLGLLATSQAADRGRNLRPAPVIENPPDVLWRNPGDIRDRDLFYGSGGQSRSPIGRFTFVEEDLGASSPKFVVRDEYGAEWKAKLGAEARAETAAARFVWAVGYITDEDYLIPNLRVANLKKLRRGQRYVGLDGSVSNVRLERSPRDGKKIGSWSWESNPFYGTRELNGLRLMMALLNNWDLKDAIPPSMPSTTVAHPATGMRYLILERLWNKLIQDPQRQVERQCLSTFRIYHDRKTGVRKFCHPQHFSATESLFYPARNP
jgi:hypothetical protein